MAFHPRQLPDRIGALWWPVRLVLPVAFGVLTALGHEAWSVWNVPVFAGLVVLLLGMPKDRRMASWFGWLAGLGYFATTLRWIIEPFLVDPVRHGWMAPFAIGLLAGGLALFWGLAFWLGRWTGGRGPAAVLWTAVFLTAVELLRGHIFTGFPWGLVSYALVGSVWDVWFAWVGPYGLSGLVFLVASATAFSLQKGRALIGPALIWPASVAALVGATIGLNALTPKAPDSTGDSTVRVIQPNAPQHLKWDRDWMQVFFDRAVDLTAEDPSVDVVIWPETSVPTLLEYADPLFDRMSRAAGGASLVAGIQRRDGDDYFNSAVVLEGPQTVADIYDKAHLVPFGEYIPFANLLEPLGLGTLVEQVAGFSAGARGGLVDVDGLGRVRVLICYEGIFPEEIAWGDQRADVLLILTNDAWFGGGAGPRQHLVQAQARAIEQGLPVIRSANTGISAVIDARGRIVASLPLNEAGFLDVAVPAALPVTAYGRIGDWPLFVVLLICVAAGAALRRRFAVDAVDRRR